MSALALLAVVLGAAIGAPSRYLLERTIAARTLATAGSTSAWVRQPWGLIVVNVSGSAVVGLAMALTYGNARVVLVTGFCGAFTTFSGYAWTAFQAWREDRAAFWAGLLMMTGMCVLAFALTFSVARTLAG